MLDRLFSRAGFKRDSAWPKLVFQWLSISLILHLIAAVKSAGFFHPNEHFQVLEFINFKLGRSPSSDLPFEYQHFLQPWILPFFLTGITRFLSSIGILNPFDWAMSYRVIGAALGWLSLAGLTLVCALWFQDKSWRRWSVLALHLLWYIPVIHSRHSSENFGGSLFFIALSLLILGSSTRPKHPEQPGKCPPGLSLGVGLILGLAFECHFNLAWMILGLILWLAIVARSQFKTILLISTGITTWVGIGTCVDFLGYGIWTFTPWNFLSQGSAWHWPTGAIDPSPSGILILLGFLAMWVQHPLHILTWISLPLCLAFELTPSSELRFLLPLASAGGVLGVLCIAPVFNKLQRFPRYTKWLKLPAKILIVYNLTQLILVSTFPAWIPIRFLSRLYLFKPYGFQVNYKGTNFFEIQNKPLNFYRPLDISFHSILDYSELIQKLTDHETTQWLFNPQYSLPEEASQLKPWCHPEFSTFSPWIEQLLEKTSITLSHQFKNKYSNWTLYRCQSPNLLKNQIEVQMDED